MARLRERGWPHEVTYDPTRFALSTSPGGDVLYLDAIYRDWLTYPRRERAAQLDRVISPVFEAGLVAGFAEAAPRLLPAVRNLTDLQSVALDDDPASLEIWQPYQRLAGPLAIVLAMDLPNSIALVPRSKLEAWGQTFEDLLPTAIDNLVALSAVRFEQAPGGFYISNYGDGYDSSRLLMPELFHALQLKGDPVAVAITRDCVVVAGSEDIPGLTAMAEHVVRAFKEAARPMSYQPLRLHGDRWEPLTTQIYDLGELSVRQMVWDYGQQTPRLERFFVQQGIDVFVPPLHVVGAEGEAFTWTSWTESATDFLPKADGVGMTSASGQTIFRQWADIEAVCGAFLEDAAYHPPRYRTPMWPDARGIARLEGEFTTPDWWVRASA